MSDDLAAISDRIALDPDDDAARLQAAAVFDRTDPPRAEHVRLGVIVERAHLARHIAAARGEELPPKPTWARLTALETEHGTRWSGELAVHGDPTWNLRPCHFDRGFVASVHLRAEALVACADALAAHHPVEELHIAPPVDLDALPLARVLALPVMRRLSVLGLSGWRLEDEDCEALAACENLPRCESIHLRQERLTDDRLAILASSERLRRLASIGVNEACLAPDDAGGERVWLSERGERLEAAYGTIRWLRPSRVRELGAGRFAVRVLRALRAEGLESTAFDLGPAAGTYRALKYDGITGGEFPVVVAALQAQGYREGTGSRLSYGVAIDRSGGWGAWLYGLDVIEFSDAPVAGEIARILDAGR